MAKINFDNITGNEAVSFEETTSQTGKQMPEFDMPDKNVSPVDQRSGMTLEEISDPSKIKVSIADYDTPFVVLFGPPSCGKTMTLVRLARYLRKQTYTVEIVRSFRPAYDNKYKELCDNFDKLIESDEAAKSTADINFMLVKVFYRSKPICQILEAPGEAYFMPSEPNKDFPRYVNAIINHNNRRIWIVLVEPDSTNANMDDEARRNYVNKVRKLKTKISPRDKIIFLYNKIDETNYVRFPGNIDYEEAVKDVNHNYPNILEHFKNENPITKLWKSYNCDLLAFQTGTYDTAADGGTTFEAGNDVYPMNLWQLILKRIRG